MGTTLPVRRVLIGYNRPTMSQVAVTACPEGIVVASESLISYERGSAKAYAQKVFPLGPRLVFAAVGNASMPDPRIDDGWPGLGAHLRTLTAGQPAQSGPDEAAQRIAEFVLDVLQYMAERPRGWEGIAISTWHVRYVVAGYGPDGGPGVATCWTATPAGAFEDERITTETKGKVALGVFDVWPRSRGREIARSRIGGEYKLLGEAPPSLPSSDDTVLDRAERAAVRVVRLACRRYPRACAEPLQVLRIEPGRGFRWTDRPEWIDDTPHADA